MLRKATLITVLSLCIPLVANARTYKDDKAKVQVDIPDKWKVEAEEDSLMAQSPDGEIGLIFLVMDAAAVDKALDEMEKELSKIFKDVKPDGEAEEVTINGMKGVSIDAKGKIRYRRTGEVPADLQTNITKLLAE